MKLYNIYYKSFPSIAMTLVAILWFDTLALAAFKGEISSAETEWGVLTTNEVDTFTFTGIKEQTVIIQMNASNQSFDPLIELVASDSSIEKNKSGSGKFATALLDEHKLEKSGLYRIVVRDAGSNDTSNYNLSFLIIPGPTVSIQDQDGGNILSGETKNGTIDRADTDAYMFFGLEDESITIQMSATNTSFRPVIDLYSPDGEREKSVKASGGSQVVLLEDELEESGFHTIVVRDDSGHETSSYNLSFLEDTPITTTTLTPTTSSSTTTTLSSTTTTTTSTPTTTTTTTIPPTTTTTLTPTTSSTTTTLSSTTTTTTSTPTTTTTTTTPASLSTGAYSLISKRITANETNFFVYQDKDSGFNHGFPSGFFGAANKIDIDAACIDDLQALNGCSADPNILDSKRGTVLRISFSPLLTGEFAGVNIEEPENWGTLGTGMGHDLSGATNVVFDVRSPTPGGTRMLFGIGGIPVGFIDILQDWTTMTIPIPLTIDITDVHILFSVVTNDINASNGATVLLDNIRFEPVPVSQKDILSFPISTETFGVRHIQNPDTGRVPFPSDQALGNLTTTYESAIALISLLERGKEEDLRNARLIADTLIYSLNHENSGDPIPTASDGSTGHHNGYISGDIALFNDQGPGNGKNGTKGDVRLAGFSASQELCSPTGFCLVLDGATGGNNAFAIMALLKAFEQFKDDGDAQKYLDGARAIASWISNNLTDNSGTGFGGYFLGYPDEGIVPKTIIKSKSTENNADIFAAFTMLSFIENELGNIDLANEWTMRANVAGDFVMEMFDSDIGRFYAGTAPAGAPSGPGIEPAGQKRGDDVINTFDFLDASTFTTLALATTPRYKDQIDWRRPVQHVLDNFAQVISVNDEEFLGFNIVDNPSFGPNGIAWEFTAQVVVTMRLADSIFQDTRFQMDADFYLNQIRHAILKAPFGDGQGIVASTLQDGDQLPPLEHCLSTPFQCIPERVGLAATVWAIFAEENINPLLSTQPIISTTTTTLDGETTTTTSTTAPPTTTTTLSQQAIIREQIRQISPALGELLDLLFPLDENGINPNIPFSNDE